MDTPTGPQTPTPTASAQTDVEIVINDCVGGFGMSPELLARMSEGTCTSGFGVKRADPSLVKAVHEIGPAASDKYAELVVVSVNADLHVILMEFAGHEFLYTSESRISCDGRVVSVRPRDL